MATISISDFKLPNAPGSIPSTGSDEEDSFVVLGKSLDPDLESMGYYNNGEANVPSILKEKEELIAKEISNISQSSVLSSMPALEAFEPNDVISMVTISSDISPEEIQKKIDEVIEENRTLRDTIELNNQHMHSNYKRIIEWQKAVQSAFDDHKLKFMNASEVIKKLKEEINILKPENDKLLLQVCAVDKGLPDEITMLEQEIEKLKDDLEKQKQTNSELEQNKNKLEEDLKKQMQINAELEQDKNKLEEDLKEQVQINAELEQDKNKIAEDLKEAKSKMQKFENLQINKSSEDNILQMEVDVSNKKVKELAESLEKLKFENSQIRDKFDTKLTNEEVLRSRVCELEGQLDSSKKLEEQMRWEMGRIQALAKQTEDNLKMEVNNMVAAQQRLTEQFEQKDRQLMSAQEALTGMQYNKNIMLAQTEAKENEIAALKAQLEKVSQEKEEIYKIQLDTFKADFEAERQAKVELKLELDQVSSDLMNLQRRNHQMQEEIEALREPGWVAPPSPSVSRMSSSSSRHESGHSPPLQRYTCPMCMLQFRSLRMVQDHVETCGHNF